MPGFKDPVADAIEQISLPRHALIALVDEYVQTLREQEPERAERFAGRIDSEEGFAERAWLQAGNGVVGATLIVTLEPTINFERLKDRFESAQGDEDLLALRQEIMQRAVSMNKELKAITRLTQATIDKRQSILVAI